MSKGKELVKFVANDKVELSNKNQNFGKFVFLHKFDSVVILANGSSILYNEMYLYASGLFSSVNQ